MNELDLVHWRRRVFALYASVRAQERPEVAHALWRAGRDALFWEHPQSPLPPSSPLRQSGLRYWPYDGALRFELPLATARVTKKLSVPTDSETTTVMRSIGSVQLPLPVEATVEVWWLEEYGGGVFLPLRDGTAGSTSYGGGRYLLDTVKGADLGCGPMTLTVDLNFLYHPSCFYSSDWQCPLAPPENTVSALVCAGERI